MVSPADWLSYVKTFQKLLALLGFVAMFAGSVMVGVPSALAADPRYVTTQITPIEPSVYSGDPLGYRVGVQCSNPLGCSTIQLTVPAPPAWQSSFGNPTVALEASHISLGITYAVQFNGTIVLTWPNSTGGNGQSFQMDWPTQNYNTVPGPQPMTVSATTSDEPGTEVVRSTSNLLNAAPNLAITKTGPATSTPGGLVSYLIKSTNYRTDPTTAQGGLSVLSVTSDVLPPSVTFVSCSESCTYDAGTRTATWPAITLAGEPDGAEYTVTYRLPTTAQHDETFTNTATVVGSPLGGGPPLTASAPATTRVVVGLPVLAANVTKDVDYSPVQPGTTNYNYYVTVHNTSNVPVDATISDVIPAEFSVRWVSLYFRSPYANIAATFTVVYDDGSTRSFVAGPTGVEIAQAGLRVVSITTTHLELPPERFIQMNINGSVLPTAVPGTTIRNCGDSTITYPGSPDVTGRACIDVPIVPFATLARLNKVALQTTPVAVGQVVDWQFSIDEDSGQRTPTRTQPELIDLVPNQLTYVTGSFRAAVGNQAGCPVTSDFAVTVVPNFANGRTAVIATTAAPGTGATLPRGTCRYLIATTVNDATPAGVYGGPTGAYPFDPAYRGNELFLFDARDYQIAGYADLVDIDRDGNTTEVVQFAAANFSVAQSAALKVVKWVQGDQDTELFGSAEQDPLWFGTSSVGGTVDWEVQLGNAGNSPMNRLVAYDLLPSPGNTGVTVSRYTDVPDPVIEWVPTMTGPIVNGDEVTIYYSTNADPCRPEMDSSGSLPIYCGGDYQLNSDWVAEGATTGWVLSDWAKVRAIRFDFGTATIFGGTYYNYRWRMSVPATMADLAGSPLVEGAATWNKIAANGYTDIYSNTPTSLLPTEAPWVKDIIHLVAPVPVTVGDYVFIDVNRDGLQDVTDVPLAGVTVTLYQADGVTPVTTDAFGNPVVSLVTDAAGLYEFGNLLPGEYVVIFTVPAGYTPTISGDIVGVGNDSNGVTATSAVLVPGGSDRTLDLGVVSFDLLVSKVLASVGPFYPGSMVTFELVPHNDGPADALSGWSVTEVLPAGLSLVSMSGAGYSCMDLTCTAEAGLAAGADAPMITVTATINAGVTTTLHNVAYVSPGPFEVPETNPLVVPSTTTDTSSTPTNNDAQADVAVGIVVAVGDYVFIDVNRDGLQDGTDIPLAGVTATLYQVDGVTPVTVDANGNPVTPLVTDAAGHYVFSNLLPGGYVVIFTVPAGYSPTTSTNTVGVGNDSNGLTATSAVLSSGQTDTTLDLGLVALNLTLTKTVTTAGPVKPGDTVVFKLVPHNNGPVNALAGWSVTDVMPAGLTLVSMTGAGYICDVNVCTAESGLAAGADGPTITVTATVGAATAVGQRNVAYITPGPGEVTETNPLVVPTAGTNTASTPTDNDAHADIDVELPIVVPPVPALPPLVASLPPLPPMTAPVAPTLSPGEFLPSTGTDAFSLLSNSISILGAGCVLLLLARRRNRRTVG